MKEEYLHYIWRNKCFPEARFTTVSGEEIKLIDFGEYNEHESGPDFFNGKLEIEGIILAGNIELHVKSSDWFKHQHQDDQAYDNVILHVVYENDQQIELNNRTLLTIELKPLIDTKHYDWFKRLYSVSTTIPCEKMIEDIDPVYFNQQLHRALHLRMLRKINPFIDVDAPEQVLYTLIARSFGSKVNATPFEELSRQLPYHRFATLRLKEKEVYLQLTSGLLSVEATNQVHYQWLKECKERSIGLMNATTWKRKGARSARNPLGRVELFASFISSIDLRELIQELIESDDVLIVKKMLDRFEMRKLVGWTPFVEQQLVINAFAVWMYWYSEKYQDEKMHTKAEELLVQTKAEDNAVTRKWKKLNKRPKNAYESQGLLEIYNEFCINKKCLSCEVGSRLLKR